MAKSILNLYLLIGAFIAVAVNGEAKNDGKYRSSKYNSGKYVPGNEGKYVPMRWPYIHIHDNRELGKYVHINIPYDGGFGPYSGDIDKYRYNYDPAGEYSQSKYTVSNPGQYDPFNAQAYDIPKPAVLLEYGFPNISPKVKRSIADNGNNQEQPKILLANAFNPNSKILEEYETEQQYDIDVLDPQTTTTTTPRPRVRYDDEGKWRIIRQEEKKNQKKYDYLYLTENGIYAEEQAKLTNANANADGTHGKGYYHYTGDDGKLYQVVYTIGEQGFVPMAEHIPTPPPIPEAIRKALDYVATKETLDNGKYDPNKYDSRKRETNYKSRTSLQAKKHNSYY